MKQKHMPRWWFINANKNIKIVCDIVRKLLIIPYINVNSFSRISNALRFSISNDILSNVSITQYMILQSSYVDILSSRKNIKLELKHDKYFTLFYLNWKYSYVWIDEKWFQWMISIFMEWNDILDFVAIKNIFKATFNESLRILM